MAYGFGILSGKKKFILAGVAALGVIAAYLVGDADLAAAAKSLFALATAL